MKSISWMTFILVVAFAMYLRSFETFSSSGRDQITVLEAKTHIIERSLSSVESRTITDLKELKDVLDPSTIDAPRFH